MTIGCAVARMVPRSGMLIWKSERNSRSSASNSWSERSISSTRSTRCLGRVRAPAAAAGRSGNDRHRCRSRARRHGGWRAAGAGSSIRRAHARHRCPHSIAAAPDRGRAVRAIALAASVLPTPGAPSSSSGLPSLIARKMAVARLSSARIARGGEVLRHRLGEVATVSALVTAFQSLSSPCRLAPSARAGCAPA